jgi:hypothetical protein
MFQRFTLYSVLSVLLFSCAPDKKKEVSPVADASNGTYFSITQFALDQWNTFRGQPYGMQKVVYMNDKVDSTDLTAFSMDWGSVFKVFFATDISDPKYLDHYRFTMFEDNTTTTRNFYYEAIDDDLFTRKFQVSADLFTDKIRSIYIETERKNKSGTTTQKLMYIPMKKIDIQEFDWASTGQHKDMHIEYRFL